MRIEEALVKAPCVLCSTASIPSRGECRGAHAQRLRIPAACFEFVALLRVELWHGGEGEGEGRTS